MNAAQIVALSNIQVRWYRCPYDCTTLLHKLNSHPPHLFIGSSHCKCSSTNRPSWWFRRSRREANTYTNSEPNHSPESSVGTCSYSSSNCCWYLQRRRGCHCKGKGHSCHHYRCIYIDSPSKGSSSCWKCSCSNIFVYTCSNESADSIGQRARGFTKGVSWSSFR